MGEHTQLAFERLEGRSNYANWKFGMKMALVHDNLWSCIEQSSPSTTGTKQDIEQSRLDQRALAKICLMVKPCIYPYIKESKTAREAWQNLEATFDDRGLS